MKDAEYLNRFILNSIVTQPSSDISSSHALFANTYKYRHLRTQIKLSSSCPDLVDIHLNDIGHTNSRGDNLHWREWNQVSVNQTHAWKSTQELISTSMIPLEKRPILYSAQEQTNISNIDQKTRSIVKGRYSIQEPTINKDPNLKSYLVGPRHDDFTPFQPPSHPYHLVPVQPLLTSKIICHTKWKPRESGNHIIIVNGHGKKSQLRNLARMREPRDCKSIQFFQFSSLNKNQRSKSCYQKQKHHIHSERSKKHSQCNQRMVYYTNHLKREWQYSELKNNSSKTYISSSSSFKINKYANDKIPTIQTEKKLESIEEQEISQHEMGKEEDMFEISNHDQRSSLSLFSNEKETNLESMNIPGQHSLDSAFPIHENSSKTNHHKLSDQPQDSDSLSSNDKEGTYSSSTSEVLGLFSIVYPEDVHHVQKYHRDSRPNVMQRPSKIHLLRIFDRPSDLDPLSPNNSIRADYTSFLKSSPPILFHTDSIFNPSLKEKKNIQLAPTTSLPTIKIVSNQFKQMQEFDLNDAKTTTSMKFPIKTFGKTFETFLSSSLDSQLEGDRGLTKSRCQSEISKCRKSSHVWNWLPGKFHENSEFENFPIKIREKTRLAETDPCLNTKSQNAKYDIFFGSVHHRKDISSSNTNHLGDHVINGHLKLAQKIPPAFKYNGSYYHSFNCYSSSSHSLNAHLNKFDLDNQPPCLLNHQNYCQQDYLYNQRFQEILQLKGTEKYIQMAALGQNFAHLAKGYCRIIISERCLPHDHKSIKPIPLGGRAGGEKFVVQGIIFKYALDVNISNGDVPVWLYGGEHRNDYLAGKAAGNELLALSNFIMCDRSKIHFPLMAIFDYCGYRIVAVTKLPISHETIVYGSDDAGNTVHNKDPIVHQTLAEIGKYLNLREHQVFDTNIFGAGDMEVHIGYDGLYYMIDFARAFPPEAPQSDGNSQGIFSRLLRPELVRKLPKPLSSDAFSQWQTEDKLNAELNNDVFEATQYYLNEIISEYPTHSFLTDDFQNHFKSEVCNIADFHRSGINYRHMGHVRNSLYKYTQVNDTLYLIEMICRTLKEQLGSNWRELMDNLIIFAEEPFREEALLLFNVISRPKRVTKFWKLEIKYLIIEKYGPESLHTDEMDPNMMLIDKLNIDERLYLVQQLASHLNFEFQQVVWQSFRQSMENKEEFEFLPQDIQQMKPRVKHLSVIDLAMGILLFVQVTDHIYPSRLEANLHLLEEAKKHLLQAWARVFDCRITKHFLGKLWFSLGKLKPNGGCDFGRALVILTGLFPQQGSEFDLETDIFKAAVLCGIFEKELVRFQQAKSIYTNALKNQPDIGHSMVDEVSNWLLYQEIYIKQISPQVYRDRFHRTLKVLAEFLEQDPKRNQYFKMLDKHILQDEVDALDSSSPSVADIITS